MPAATPQYLQIQTQLADEIAQGLLGADAKLAGERELAVRFGCTRVTLREALQQLEAEGLIYRENRRGWYVAPPRIRYNPTRLSGFMDYVAAQGRRPRTETLAAELRAAGPRLAARLQLAEDAPVFHLTRRRWVDQRPVLIEINVIDASWCPGLLDHQLDTSLTWLFRQKFGLQQTRCELAMHSSTMPAPQAALMQIASGAPSLQIERLCYAAGNSASAPERPVEFDQEFWRPDALSVELEASLSGRPSA